MCHGQGKVREILVLLEVRERSGNSVASQGILHLTVIGKSQGILFVVPIDTYLLLIAEWYRSISIIKHYFLIKMWQFKYILNGIYMFSASIYAILLKNTFINPGEAFHEMKEIWTLFDTTYIWAALSCTLSWHCLTSTPRYWFWL